MLKDCFAPLRCARNEGALRSVAGKEGKGKQILKKMKQILTYNVHIQNNILTLLKRIGGEKMNTHRHAA